MKQLWAPWRMQYILNAKKEKGCLFCNLFKLNPSKKNLILYKNKTTLIVMNKFPYNSGHLMVASKTHKGNLHELPKIHFEDLFKKVSMTTKVLKKVLNPEGFNIGANIGRCAGAGVLNHLHIHIVPRWNGDMNYMPVLSDTKVISEYLEKTYDKLLRHFKIKNIWS